jgi:NADPH:quinone reductase-like Zn-dependent oxidoreductase
MKAVVITTPGDADVLQIQDVDDPQLNDDEVLIKVSAAGLNRSDISQRLGQYPPPKGARPYPGVECSGVIEAVGKDVQKWEVGDEVSSYAL